MFPPTGTYQTLVVRQHDNYLSVVVPNHPPKVCGGVRQRMLGNDKLITPEVTLRATQGENKVSGTEGCKTLQRSITSCHHVSAGLGKLERQERHTVPLCRTR